jgi:hypothetical protein
MKKKSDAIFTSQDIVNHLNRLLELDRELIEELFDYHGLCNNLDMAKKNISLLTYSPSNRRFKLGFLGILNGLFASEYDISPIKAVYDEDDELVRFKCIVREDHDYGPGKKAKTR